MILKAFRALGAFLVLCFFYLQPLWAESEHATIRLLSSVESVGEARELDLGVVLSLKPDWHTYWRTPGVGGYGLRLDWTGSENIASNTQYWPIPQWFKALGVFSVGYVGEVVLPIRVTLKDPGKPVKIRIKADYLVCSSSKCVPHNGTLSLDLPAGPLKPSPDAGRLVDAQRKVPELWSSADISFKPRVVLGDPRAVPNLVRVHASSQRGFRNLQAFLELPGEPYVKPPVVTLSEDKKEADILFSVYADEMEKKAPKKSLLNRPVSILITDGDQQQQVKSTLAMPALNIQLILLVLGGAFLGGFILNFMPCVLPVLSLKTVAILKQQHLDRKAISAEYWATTLGILFCFYVLGQGLIILKNIGMTVGWGMQFQQPTFLTFISIVLILTMCNLWGFFEVRLPTPLVRMANLGMAFGGMAQHFFMGAFITLLATPCTAPFLATAVSFALTRGAWEILFVFMGIGTGLAFPYILIALFPGVVRFFPKPGAWMDTLRKVLGACVFATVIWLLMVAYTQMGITRLLWIVGFFSLIIILLSARHFCKAQGNANFLWTFVTVLSLGALSVALTAPAQVSQKFSSSFEKFDRDAIVRHVGQGKIVFVDVTADWCLTCKANEKLVIDTWATRQLFERDKVIMMKADWTSPDPVISEFLASHGEYGIPFCVIYGPGEPRGIKLPQILTFEAIKGALVSAHAPKTAP